MAQATVSGEFSVSADVLWTLVRDFGNVSWMQGATSTDVEGEGPGMFRVFHVGDAPPVRERLETVDEENRTITYTIPEGIPMPVKNYHSTMRVSGDSVASRLEWIGKCDPDGVTEAEAAATVEGMYQAMIGWIKEALGSD
ncbi:SRPBCC family protein [Myxococcota bacterium]|nr:SRPBCC family protein [Myxococcota bacterium]